MGLVWCCAPVRRPLQVPGDSEPWNIWTCIDPDTTKHHKTPTWTSLDIKRTNLEYVLFSSILQYFTYGKLSPKIDQYISISLNQKEPMTCNLWHAKAWRAAMGWLVTKKCSWSSTRVDCGLCCIQRKESKIRDSFHVFMSSCHSNSFYAWKIFPEMSKMRSLRWSWCMVAVSQNTASQPESQHIKAPATETTGIIPRIRRP